MYHRDGIGWAVQPVVGESLRSFYQANFTPAGGLSSDMEATVDRTIGALATMAERLV